MEPDGQESDAENWMEPRKALLKPYPPVILESSITALCAGKFGRSILVGTCSGVIAKISWLGEVLQLFRLMDSHSLSSAPSMSSFEGNMYDREIQNLPWMASTVSSPPNSSSHFGIKSITFNNSLQLLAMVRVQGQEEHGSLCLGILCGDKCFVRAISITESDNENIAKGTRSPAQRAWKGFQQESSSVPHESKASEGKNSTVSVTHAVFSSAASLLGVCLLDGTILVSHMEHYRTGTRSKRKFSLRRMSSENYKLILGGMSDSSSHIKLDEDIINEEAIQSSSYRESKMAELWGYEVQHLLCLNSGNNDCCDLPKHSVLVQQPVSCICFSPDALAIAAAQGDSLMIWSTVDGKQLSNTHSFGDEGRNASPAGGSKGGVVQPENGPLCSLSWGYYGYRIIAALDHYLEDSEDSNSSHDSDFSPDAIIVAFDMIRSAESELSCAQLCFRSHDRVIILDTHPWEPKMRYWRTLPVHQGYIVANGPVKHVSTSPSGTHIAVSGSHGLAIFNRTQGRWHVFSSIQQERETVVSGICWWGEDAIFVLCRQQSGYELRLYPRYRLSAGSELRKPLRLTPGLKPVFMSCITEGHEESSAWLLIGGSRDYFVCHFRARENLLKSYGVGSVYLSESYESPLPHVLDEDDTAPESPIGSSYHGTTVIPAAVGAPRSMFLVPNSSPPRVAILDFCGTLAVMSLSREYSGSPSNGAAAIATAETTAPSRRECSRRNSIEVIKRGILSIVDFSAFVYGKQLFGTNSYPPNALYPCYLLHFRDMDFDQDTSKDAAANNCLQDTLWCPNLHLNKPLIQQQQSRIRDDQPLPQPPIPGVDEVRFVSAFGLSPNDINMGLVPSLGSTVHVSQTKCTSINEPMQFSLRTHIYPSLYILLRYLVVIGRKNQQQQQQSFSGQETPPPQPFTHTSGRINLLLNILASHMNRGVDSSSSPSNNILSEDMLSSDTFYIAALLMRKLVISCPECIPETLELLLRNALEEGKHSATRKRRMRRESHSPPFRKEEEIQLSLHYWAFFDSVCLCQMVPECFLEVIARTARKVEPELASFLFPIHLITAPSKLLLGDIDHDLKEGHHHDFRAFPAHLVHECIVLNRLETATWYIPLIRDDIVLGLVEGGNIEDLVGNVIPAEMYPLTISGARIGWHHGLSHALSCCLFSLVMDQGCTTSDTLVLQLLPEIWLFARKRERSPGFSTPTPTKRKKVPSSGTTPEMRHDQTMSPPQRSESSASSVGWIGWLWGSSNSNPGTQSHPVTPLIGSSSSRAMNNETEEESLRLPEDEVGEGEESNNNDDDDNYFGRSSSSSSNDMAAEPFKNLRQRREYSSTTADQKLVKAVNRARELYSMPPSDIATVLSCFLWNRLAASDVLATIRIFSSLTHGEISRDAGIDESTVLSCVHQPPSPMEAAVHDCSSIGGAEDNDTSLMDIFLSYTAACKLTPRKAVMVSVGSEERLMLEQLWRISNALHHNESMIVCALLLGETTALLSMFTSSPPRLKAGYPVFLVNLKSCIEAGTETEESILDDAVAKRLAQLLQIGANIMA